VGSPLSIVFAGTPDFSVPMLDALVRSAHRVRAVYTQPDRPAGRGRQLAASAVKQYALEHDLPVEQPLTLKDPAAIERLASWDADVMVVVAYGLLLPQAALDAPRRGCINVHASLLPRWRGAAPIQRAILAGDAETGVTIMQMEAGLDTGPMLLKRTTPILSQDTGQTLHDRLAVLGAQALIETLDNLDSLPPEKQPEEGVTYAAKLRKEEAIIDWRQPAVVLDRLVRAFNAWPVAETRWEGRQLRIWEAEPKAQAHSAAPGAVIGCSDAGIDVATGDGVLTLKRVQLAGRKAVSAAEFLRAHRLADAVLGA
jgi:methionyl-tRNA formyltransferase